jgi:hypothetical protein
MNHSVSKIGIKIILVTFFCIWLMTGFPVVDIPQNVLVVEAEAQGRRGGYVRPRPADRRTARRVHRRHHQYRTGAYVYTLSSDCSEEVVSGKTYYYCDGVYYQAQYQGNDLVYVEVEAPR